MNNVIVCLIKVESSFGEHEVDKFGVVGSMFLDLCWLDKGQIKRKWTYNVCTLVCHTSENSDKTKLNRYT